MELQASESALDQLFDNAPEAIVLLDMEDRILRVNPEFVRLFGYPAEGILQRPIGDLIVPEPLHPEAAAFTRRVIRGERICIESVRHRSDGSLIDVSVLGFPVMMNAEAVAVYEIYRDLTMQRRLEAERDELATRERHNGGGSAILVETQTALLDEIDAILQRDDTPEASLQQLARVLVPAVADSCIIYLREGEERVRRIEVAFFDPDQEDLMRDQLRHHPPEIRLLIPPVARALGNGESQLLPELSVSALKAVPGDAEHVSVALMVGLSSLLVVPLSDGSGTLGAISLGIADSGRRFNAADLALAEEVARRAARSIADRLS